MTSGVCIHGYLRRQCEACDLADQLEQMTEDRDRLRAELAASREDATTAWKDNATLLKHLDHVTRCTHDPYDRHICSKCEDADAALAPPAQEGKYAIGDRSRAVRDPGPSQEGK